MHEHLIRVPQLHKTTVNDCIGFLVKSVMAMHDCDRIGAERHIATLMEVAVARVDANEVNDFAERVAISERVKLSDGVGTVPKTTNVVQLTRKAS